MASKDRCYHLTNWRFWIKVAASLVIAAVFGVWVHGQGVSLIPDASQMNVYVQNWWGPVGFLAFLLVVHTLRAYRWLYLLRPLIGHQIRLNTLFAIVFAGFMAIMVFPLRMGELARPYLISTRGQISMSAAFGTIAIERVLDGLILSGVLTVCLLAVPRGTETPLWVNTAGVLTLGIFVTALLVLILLLWRGATVIDVLEKLGRRVWPSFATKVAGVLREFLSGLSALPNRHHLLPFVLLSLAYWGINGVGMWFLAWSGGLPVTILSGFTIMSVLGVGILIPTGPGHFGNFQAAVTAALGLEGLDRAHLQGPGSAYVFVLYLGILGVTVGAGILSLLTQHISLSRILSPTNSTEQDNEGTHV